MTQTDRDTLIRTRIDALGRVPSVRRMASDLGTDPRTIRRAYRRLGVRSSARPGRPAIGSNVVHCRLSDEDYDVACQVARQRDMDVKDVVATYGTVGIRALAPRPKIRS